MQRPWIASGYGVWNGKIKLMPGNENGLDPEQGQSDELPRRGSVGDVQPNEDDPDPRTRGGKSQEDVEDRPSVGTVKPEDYPEADRADSKP